MALFLKKSINPRDAGNPKADAAAWLIFSRCMALQLGWAAFMERQSLRLPKQARIAVFLLFASGSLTISTYLIVSSLQKTPTPKVSFSQMDAQIHNDRHTRALAVVTSRDLERVNYFTRYMDSLARSPSGKTAYDSIMSNRPGLLDSARNTILLYHQN